MDNMELESRTTSQTIFITKLKGVSSGEQHLPSDALPTNGSTELEKNGGLLMSLSKLSPSTAGTGPVGVEVKLEPTPDVEELGAAGVEIL